MTNTSTKIQKIQFDLKGFTMQVGGNGKFLIYKNAAEPFGSAIGINF